MRRAGSADATAVADVYLRAFDGAMPTVRRAHTDDEVRTWVRHVLLPAGDVLVADRGGTVVGMLALSPGWIDQLYVDPTWQRSGTGSRPVHQKRHGFVAVDRTDGSANEEREPDVRYSWRPACP